LTPFLYAGASFLIKIRFKLNIGLAPTRFPWNFHFFLATLAYDKDIHMSSLPEVNYDWDFSYMKLYWVKWTV